jgi:hypothetical protein
VGTISLKSLREILFLEETGFFVCLDFDEIAVYQFVIRFELSVISGFELSVTRLKSGITDK